MQEKVDSSYAVFWVEAADDLSSNSATIYVYYGKSDATTTSNGDNTFIFFDDFPGSSLDTNKWTILYGDPVVYNGWLELTNDKVITKNNFANNGTAYELRVSLPTKYFPSILGLCENPNGEGISGYKTFRQSQYNTASNVKLDWYDGSTWTYDQYTVTTSSGIKRFKLEMLNGNSFRNYHDLSDSGSYTSWQTVSPFTIGATYILIYTAGTGYLGKVDWIFVRKFVSPEPSHGSWGSEEQTGGQTYEIYVNAVSQSLATPAYETTYNIAKDAAIASQSVHAQETTFNLLKEVLAKSLVDFAIETKFNVERDAVAQTLASVVVETISGVIEIFKEATATAQTTFTLESAFNIIPEAAVKVLAEVTILKPTEVKVTKLFLVMGDLAIQIQGV